MTLSKPTIAATACLTVFAGLAGAKLAGLVAWSWWWIAAPIWLPATALVVSAIAGFLLLRFTWPKDEDPDIWH